MIDKPAQIRCLASPIRQEIVDAIAAGGPMSMSELARHLGRAADGLYFHVRALARVGLLVEQSSVRSGKRFAAVYDVPFRPLMIERSPRRAPSIARVIESALRLAGRDAGRALRNPKITTVGTKRELTAGRVKGWLTLDERKHVNVLLDEMLGILRSSRPGPDRELQAFTYVLAPAPPSRRAARLSKEKNNETDCSKQ